MSSDWITTEVDEAGIGVLTLQRPEVMNALSPAFLTVIAGGIDRLVAEGARVIVLTGGGRGFCAGADLQGAEAEAAEAAVTGRSVLETAYHPFLRRLRDCPVPLIAAVNGVAAGAGMSLALSCDFIACARSAYFFQAFRRIGLVPDCGSSWILPRLIGLARARELSLLGEKITAETALDWGLVNRVFEDAELMERTREIARSFADGPVAALGHIRQLYWASTDNSYEDQLALEDRLQTEASAGAEFAEGVAAFMAKRPADFRNAR